MGSSEPYWWKWKQYLKPHVYKPFIIIHVFNLTHIVCQTNFMVFQDFDIILGSVEDGMLGFGFVAELILIVKLVFIVTTCVILFRAGRRIVCVFSGLVSGIAAVIIGTFVYMQTIHKSVIIGLLLIYVAFNTCGYFVMAQTMIGEILPSNIRCVAGAYIFTTYYMANLFEIKYFYKIDNAVGTHGHFWIFGVSSLLCSLFLYLMLPVTKGRFLEQIEEYFLQPNVLWLTRKNVRISGTQTYKNSCGIQTSYLDK